MQPDNLYAPGIYAHEDKRKIEIRGDGGQFYVAIRKIEGFEFCGWGSVLREDLEGFVKVEEEANDKND